MSDKKWYRMTIDFYMEPPDGFSHFTTQAAHLFLAFISLIVGKLVTQLWVDRFSVVELEKQEE